MRSYVTLPLILVLTSATLVGCISPIASLNRTLGLWHQGERSEAIALSALEYERFRDDNGLKESAIEAWAKALMERLEEEPIVAKRERLGPLPGAHIAEGKNTLDQTLRADLLSHQASRVARAIGSIAGLGLSHHATALIALVFEPKVIEPDGDVLASLDPAQRTLTIKRMALDALEALK